MAANYFLKFTPDDQGRVACKTGTRARSRSSAIRWGVTQAGGYCYGSGGDVGQGQPPRPPVSFRMCPASPKLMQYCATGKHLDTARADLPARRARRRRSTWRSR